MNKLIIITLFSLVSITWGTTWIAMKIATETIPPLFATGMRFLLTAPLLIIISYFTKTPLLFPYGQRLFQIIIAIFYFSIPFTLMLYSGIYVSSSIASIIFSNMPVAVLIISALYLKKRIFFIQKIGILLASITLSMLLLIELKSQYFFQWKGIVALLIALFSHAIIYAKCQQKCCNVSVLTFNALPSLISGILITIMSLFIENFSIHTFSYVSILAVLYLSFFSGIFGILSYFYLQKKVSAFYASIVFLIFPIISWFSESYFYGTKIILSEIWLLIPLIIGILMTLIPIKLCNKIKTKI